MLKINNFEKIHEITDLLAMSLAAPDMGDMPPDVATALTAAKKQMENLPEVIEDLNLAFNRYMTLNRAISRMIALARESIELGEDPLARDIRTELEEEFVSLAAVVAKEAGRQYFQGPSLTISHRIGALAAAKVLSVLKPILENLDQEIKGQKEIILEAIEETINFLGIVAMCYPHVEGVELLRSTLEKVRLPKKVEDPVVYAPTLH
ncbi:MAG: hypothetical protein LBV23_01600 [Deltaproteobacteria bacterium]|jgi:hypothetical protein|nr:hypothetical protein [Deltaproteobacteria bacterium]